MNIAWNSPIFIRRSVFLASCMLLMGADLPDNVPLPIPRPVTAPEPDRRDDGKVSQPKTDDIKAKEPDKDGDKTEPQEKVEEYIPPPIEKEDPAMLAACMAELKTLGVVYKEIPRIDDGGGCGIDHPITVTSVGGDVSLKPEGTMRCDAALQLARWTKETVIPTLRIAKPGETLAALDQASTYICRKRNNAETGKISEHAHGNAVDIAGFTFKSGKTFSIEPRMKDSTLEGAFQRAIATAACLHFTTVLDPGSDSAHETHLHLDVIKRKGDFRYCW